MSPSGKKHLQGSVSPSKGSVSPSKKPALHLDKGKSTKEEEKNLSSPTSISMYNSFIIKNADDSFDHYYHSMKKRKQMGHNTSHLDQSMTGGDSKFGIVRGKKPTARDGHTANVDTNGFMYVFGGDRHHMPFNDLYIIKLPRN
jgi:hypothetical protein